MRKRKIYKIFFAILILSSSLLIKYRIENQIYYMFQKDIKNEFEYIDKIDISNYGPHCTFYIYVDKDHCSYKEIEPVFINIMKGVLENSIYQYFKKRHNKYASGELVFLHVSFYEEGEEDNVLYKYTSYKDFQVWELECDESIIFNIADYKE